MYIKTQEFNLTKKQFRELLAAHYYKQMKKISINLSILALMGLGIFLTSHGYFLLIMVLVLIASYISVPYLINLDKTQSHLNFKGRFCEIDENFITFIYEDGSLVKLRFDSFREVTKESNYYFLYMTNNQFHYLPIATFNSEQEISRFELLMQGKQLLKLW